MNQERFRFAESLIAEALGVSRELLVEIRAELKNEEDWAYGFRGAIQWSEAGITSMLAMVDPDAEERAAAKFVEALEAAAKQPDEAGLVGATFDRHYPNPTIKAARLPDGTQVRVRMKPNDTFSPGMPMQLRHLNSDLYELASPYPRKRT